MSKRLGEHRLPSGQVLAVHQGDLTEEDADAIVNAANSSLQHGGGVAGAIVRRGGAVIQQESEQLAPVPTGEAVITGAGRLPARYVIHAVGPVWGTGDEDRLLHDAVTNALLRAHENELCAVALPAISTGVFGFPKERGARVIVQAALDFCARYPDSSLREIRFVNVDAATVNVFLTEFASRWGAPGAAA